MKAAFNKYGLKLHGTINGAGKRAVLWITEDGIYLKVEQWEGGKLVDSMTQGVWRLDALPLAALTWDCMRVRLLGAESETPAPEIRVRQYPW